MIQKPKGTKDLLPIDTAKWQFIEYTIKSVLENYAFNEIRVPVFEHTELFLRGVGETTDVVQKEMYTFKDKGDRSITLRPEGTAGVVRAYIENGMASLPSPIKLWYNITAYRYENVQKGRLREFHQIGAELIGTNNYMADAELITMANEIFRSLNIKKIKLEINSIGCPVCRAKYQEALREYIGKNIDKYCSDCKRRLEKNPMRILDCKVESCKEQNQNASVILDYLCEECKEHFEKVQEILRECDIKYEINPKIVRGLDYYTKTVFEFIDEEEGLTVLAGGRYDGLVKELEGQDTPAVGFALGMERLLELFDKYNENIEVKKPEIFVATIGEEANKYATRLVQKLRAEGKYVVKDITGKGLNAQFKYANKIRAKYVITLGDDEIKNKVAKIKNMETGEEEEYKIEL